MISVHCRIFPHDDRSAIHPSCAIAPHRGDVTTVRAAAVVRLQAEKRLEEAQAHVASHRTVEAVTLPLPGWIEPGRAGQA